jgi:RNA polymerase sigma-70 factor (ECF subfamily)
MPSSRSDEEVMLQVREGAGEMLGILFDRYHAKLFNYYVRLTGDRALSEDLVQDVFYRILRSRRTYRPGSPFRPWMYQVARNARIDHLRRPAEVALEDGMAEPIVPPAELSDREQNELLLRALLKLSEDKREVLLLSRFQGMTYKEIAQLLGCDVGTIKTRVFRAIRELRQIIADWDAGSRPHSRTRGAYEM